MPSFPHSSPISAPCRLEWRPSRWLQAALILLAVLAPCSVLASAVPRILAWPLAALALAAGLWRARREGGRAPRQLCLGAAIAGAEPRDTLDGQRLHGCEVRWRGPLAFVHVLDRNGRGERLVWWPDTLPPPRRRELRLAVAARAASRGDRPVAP